MLEKLQIELDFYQISIPEELLAPYKYVFVIVQCIITYRAFYGSNILNDKQKKQLLFWIDNKSANLIYSATQHGFSASSFHQHCDNKGGTITVIRTSQGYIFGGFTEHSWESKDALCTKIGASWIFTLCNPYNIVHQYFPDTGNKIGITCNSAYGPVFGASDIAVSSDSNYSTSSIKFPNCYQDTTGRGVNVFAGSSIFQTNEVEVFKVQ